MKMTKHLDYQKRFDSFSNYKLYQNLEKRSRNAIKDIGMKYQLTYQELRQLTDMAVDFVMWDESSIGKQWNYEEKSIQYSDRLAKNKRADLCIVYIPLRIFFPGAKLVSFLSYEFFRCVGQ